MRPPESARLERLATEAPGTSKVAGSVAPEAAKLHLTPLDVLAIAALLDRPGVAALLKVSRSFVQKLHDTGRLPMPVRLGRAVRWRRDELLAWIDAGCPSRDSWEAQRGREA